MKGKVIRLRFDPKGAQRKKEKRQIIPLLDQEPVESGGLYLLKEQSPFEATSLDVPTLPDEHFETKKRSIVKKEIDLCIAQVKKYKREPMKFVKHELGIPVDIWRHDCPPDSWVYNPAVPMPLWSKQRFILNSLIKHRKVAVKSCHSAGKTYIAAIATLYFAYVWKALGVTTAPTGRQVKRLLWADIADVWNRANQWQLREGKPGLGGRLLQTSLELGDKWFVEGFSTDQQEHNLPGFHEENVFAIVDEACGVNPSVFTLLETILNAENSFVLYIGNPVDSKSEFKKCFQPNSDFFPITISAKDTPNVRNKKQIYVKLVNKEWPHKMYKKFGKKSAFCKSRVDAEFPDADEDGLIPMSKIEGAMQRSLPENEIISIGGDIARLGGDAAVFAKRHLSGKFRIIDYIDRSRITEAAGRLIVKQKECNLFNKEFFKKQLLKGERTDVEDLSEKIAALEEKVAQLEMPEANRNIESIEEIEAIRTPILNIDDIGVGGGVTDICIEENYPTNGINVAEAPDPGVTADEKGLVEFANKRAQYFWQLRKAFMADRVDIDPEDEDLIQELLALEYTQTRKGKLIIVEKDRIKKKIGRSPDRVESMMLAFAMDTEDDVTGLIQFA